MSEMGQLEALILPHRYSVLAPDADGRHPAPSKPSNGNAPQCRPTNKVRIGPEADIDVTAKKVAVAPFKTRGPGAANVVIGWGCGPSRVLSIPDMVLDKQPLFRCGSLGCRWRVNQLA